MKKWVVIYKDKSLISCSYNHLDKISYDSIIEKYSGNVVGEFDEPINLMNRSNSWIIFNKKYNKCTIIHEEPTDIISDKDELIIACSSLRIIIDESHYKKITLDESEIFIRIVGVIDNNNLNYNIDNPNLETHLFSGKTKNSFEWDSLDFVTFIMEIENCFKINIKDEDIIEERDTTLRDYVNLIQNYLK